jgi:hypothetical protein
MIPLLWFLRVIEVVPESKVAFPLKNSLL